MLFTTKTQKGPVCKAAMQLLVRLNPLSTIFLKWPNTVKQFVGKLPTNCLSVFGHFKKMVLKGITINLKLLNIDMSSACIYLCYIKEVVGEFQFSN